MAQAVHQMPWYQNQEFVAARVTAIPPNDRTTYVEPRPVGENSPTDVTAFQYGQREWSKRNMPAILYVLEPPADWGAFRRCRKPGQKRDAQGNLMFERWPANAARPRRLLDFEVLPDQIGSREDWFIIEAWRRLDPRITWQDIHMRIETPHRPSDVNLRSRSSRHRVAYRMASWFYDPQSSRNMDVRNHLTAAQIAGNTTRGATPGLIDPQNAAAGRIPHPGENDQSSNIGQSTSTDSSQDSDISAEGSDEEVVTGDMAGAGPSGTGNTGMYSPSAQLARGQPSSPSAQLTQGGPESPGAQTARDQPDSPASGVSHHTQESSPEYQEPPPYVHWSGWRFNAEDGSDNQ